MPTDIVTPTGGQLWISSARERRLVSVYDDDPPTIADSTPTSSPPLRLASDGLSVWAAGAANDSLTKVDAGFTNEPGGRSAWAATRSTSRSGPTRYG